MPRHAISPRTSATLLAGALLVAGVLLTGCSDQDPDSAASTSGRSASPDDPETTSPSPETITMTPPKATTSPKKTPKAEPKPDDADIPLAEDAAVGRWRNKEMQWIVRIKANGKFHDDFAGVKNIRSGKWRMKGKNVVVLKGGDGVTTRGKLTAKTLTIKGTVLTRVR